MITFEKKWDCDVCGFTYRWSETRKQGGYRVCFKCYDELGVERKYIAPPTAKWDDFSRRKCEDEYGVVVWLEEWSGRTDVTGTKEYGVLTKLEGFNPLSSMSGEYGALVFMPEGIVADPEMRR